MAYEYKKDDTFYDVESLSNVFTVAWWMPHKDVNAIILSYLDDDNIITGDHDLEYIRQYIYNIYPDLKARGVHIVFENIKYTGRINEFADKQNGRFAKLGMQSFAKRLGLACQNTFVNATVQQRHNSKQYPALYYPVKDTDPDYNPDAHGFRFGYNSTNYDVTILAQMLTAIEDDDYTKEYAEQIVRYKDDTVGGTEMITAQRLRNFNDELFEPKWKGQMSMRLANHPGDGEIKHFGDFQGNFKHAAWTLRKAWLLTGRYIDVSRLNEKLQKVGLKRLLGMLGLQIMESDKLSNNTHINNLEEMADLLAYNISDVVNLQLLFEHEVYQNAFNVRGSLLETFPQTVYDQKKGFNIKNDNGAREAQVDTGNYTNIRRNRLARDSTSAKFVEYAIAPYAPIKDIETVSFMYPSEQEAKKMGVTPTNVLEDTKNFFESTVTNDPNNQAHRDFMQVYDFYKNIEGRNFNASDTYEGHYSIVDDLGAEGLPHHLIPQARDYVNKLMQKFNTNLFYHYKDADGNIQRSSCLANFSIGGIHGAEVNVSLLKYDVTKYKQERDVNEYIQSQYSDALEAINGPTNIEYPEHLAVPERLQNKIKDDGTVKIRDFMKSGSTKKEATWRDVAPVQLFKQKKTKGKDGGWQVNDRYAYVSVGPSHHEDFASYYPLLLSRLSAFINPSYHGYYEDGAPADPYYEMFETRIAKKKESKDMSLTPAQRHAAHIEQDLRKLLINAASGAGDATFDNNIRVNNAVISMRIIGQLFAWRIGQAQTMAGARVPSTNTDGLYTMDISAEDNDRILEEISKDMYIEIEPERLDRFVSKDSNNRLEYADGKIEAASGGTLTSWGGPEPTQSLDHAAIIDHILARYLADERLDDPSVVEFDTEYAKSMFHDFLRENIQSGTPQNALRFFQWIVSSSTGTHRYNYAKITNKHTGEVTIKNLQLYNRIFLVKNDNSNIRQEMYLATRRAIKAPVWTKRHKEYDAGDRFKKDLWEHNPESLEILKANGLDVLAHNNDPSSEHYKDEATVQKIRSMPAEQHIEIYNKSIVDLTDEQAIKMLQVLDIDAYVQILSQAFKSWYNVPVPTSA